MSRKGVLLMSGVTILCAIIIGGTASYLLESEEEMPPTAHDSTKTALDLGITYLPLTPNLASHYHLAVNHGAMITKVVPGSFADRAGFQKGDVIITFDGIELDQNESLLRILRSEYSGTDVMMEIWKHDQDTFVQATYPSN